MPLSEHEQRLLDQIERALYAEDPKFAHAVRATDPKVHYKRRLVKAVLGFVVGVCLLMAGVISKIVPVGVVGFLVMLACSLWGLSSWKRITGTAGGAGQAAGGATTAPPHTRRRRGGFMQRIEERWRRRQEGGGL